MAPESDRQPLPFEPKGNRKKTEKTDPAASKKAVSAKKSAVKAPKPRPGSGVPEAVSRRMLRRMALFSGLPTGLGVLIFFGSYLLLTRDLIEFPKILVLFSTLGCFGLGVLGLTYGVLSASWDEGQPGSLLGIDEFGLNFSRMKDAWGDAKKS